MHTTFGYIDRGDFSEYDFTKSHFITDFQWHDLDLSDIVPEKVELIHIRIRMLTSSLAGAYFRKKGNIYGKNISIVKTQVADVYCYEEFFIVCDTDRVIQYKASNVTWSKLDIIVRGWFI